MRGRSERIDQQGAQNTSANASFSSDARLSLFQALGLRKDNATSTILPTRTPVMPYGDNRGGDEGRHNTRGLETQSSGTKRNNNNRHSSSAPAEPMNYSTQEGFYYDDRSRTNNGRNNNSNNSKSQSYTSNASRPTEATLASVPSLKITSSSSHERIVEVVGAPHTPHRTADPVRILTRPHASLATSQVQASALSTTTAHSSLPTAHISNINTYTNKSTSNSTSNNNNTNRRGRSAAPSLAPPPLFIPSVPSTPPPYAGSFPIPTDSVYLGGKKSHITAHTHAPPTAPTQRQTSDRESNVTDKHDKQDKPVPMLLKILQAAKEKSDQRRLGDDNTSTIVASLAAPSPPLTNNTASSSASSISTAKAESKERARRGGAGHKTKAHAATSAASSPVDTTAATASPSKDANDHTFIESVKVDTEISSLQQKEGENQKSAPGLTISTTSSDTPVASEACMADADSAELPFDLGPSEILAEPSVLTSTDPSVTEQLPPPPLPLPQPSPIADALSSPREEAGTPVSMNSDSGDENLLREAAHISDSQLTVEEPYAVPDPIDPIFALSTTTAGAISVSSSSSHGSFRNSIPGRRSITISTDLYTDNGPSPLYSPYATSLYPGATGLYSGGSYGNSAYTSPFYSNNVTPQGQKPSFFSELNENYDVLVTKEEEEEEEMNGNEPSVVVNNDNNDAEGTKDIKESPTEVPASNIISEPISARETDAVIVTQVSLTSATAAFNTPVVADRVVHSFGSGGFKIGIINHSAISNSAPGSTANSPKAKDTAAVNGDSDNFAVPSVPVVLSNLAPVPATSATVTPTFAVTFKSIEGKSEPAGSTQSEEIPVSTNATTPTATTIAPLPVDAHRETILSHVRQNSVTIINGMTGCGKSTRIPIMLWEDSLSGDAKQSSSNIDASDTRDTKGATLHAATTVANDSAITPIPQVTLASTATSTTLLAPPTLSTEAFIMVSQPRRIAATALKNRLFTHYGDTIGLRLGHGMREESSNTRIWFVTTGYLVRLLAHKMHTFRHYTHLVIDEIHERSLDCDILCYLAKKLVHTYPHIRIVLMSATAHSAMFQSYFNTPHEPIFVGVRRYHLSEYFLENMHRLLPPSTHRTLNRLIESSNNITSDSVYNVVHDMLVKDQLFIAHALAKSIAKPGGAVLIFVSGMSDITELMEIFSNSNNSSNNSKKDSPKTVVLAVHSDIPHETQLLAFAPTPADQIKIVIATNAAESSVTIPDVDNVICCGTSKVLRYSERMHTTMLVNTWISKASATQRAGRTGRVRPGNVYHLYTQRLYSLFDDFEMSEVKRQPMTEVALRLKSMLRGSEQSGHCEESNGSNPAVENGGDGFSACVEEKTKQEKVPESAQRTDSVGPSEADAQLVGDEGNEEASTASPITTFITDIPVTTNKPSSEATPPPLLPSVTSVLLSLIEPPSLHSIHAALHTLHSYGMLTSSAEHSKLTEIGTLAADLPVDFMLGRFIGYAVLLGVCREAVVVAAALGNPKSLFRTPNTLVQTDTDEFNSHCRHLFLSLTRLDRGLLSEPFTAIQAYAEYQQQYSEKDKIQWCKENCIVPTRMRQLSSVVQHLYSTVYTSLSESSGGSSKGKKKSHQASQQLQSALQSLQSLPPLTPRTANLLRLCLVWAFPHHLLKQKALLCSEQQMCTIDIPGLSLPSQAFDNFVHGVFHSSASTEFTSVYNTSHRHTTSNDTTVNSSNVPDIHYSIQAIGKRTYIAPPLDRSIDAFIDSFLDFVHTLDAHVAFLTGTFIRPESVMIVFDRYVCEDRLKPYIYSIFGGNNIATLSSSAERVIYKALVTSRNQVSKLQEVFSEESWRCALFDLPGSGDATLVCANCIPSEQSIRTLFLGSDLTYRIAHSELTEQEYGWYGWEYTSKIKRSKLKVLCYEDPPSMYSSSDGYILSHHSEDRTTNWHYASNTTKLYRMETVRNIPLTIQLVNFTRYNSNADRMLKISVPSDSGINSVYAEDEDEHYNSNNNGKRTVQDARRSAPPRPAHGSSNQSYSSETVSIKMNTINTEWVRLPYVDSSYTHITTATGTNLTTTNSNEFASSSDNITNPNTSAKYIDDNKRVSFPAYSLQRYAQHLHNEPVYCVCYSLTMVAGSGSNGENNREKGSSLARCTTTSTNDNSSNSNTTYRAEGCSTLPVGSEWLSRALACVSKLNSEVTRNFKDGCRLSRQQIDLAAQIQDYLTQSSLSYCFELHNAFLLNTTTAHISGKNTAVNTVSTDVSEYSPLNNDIDTLFADYIHRGSMYAVQNHEEGEYAIDMDEFVPLGHENHKKVENKAESTTSGATNTNAWLQSSSLVRTAGNLKNRSTKNSHLEDV